MHYKNVQFDTIVDSVKENALNFYLPQSLSFKHSTLY